MKKKVIRDRYGKPLPPAPQPSNVEPVGEFSLSMLLNIPPSMTGEKPAKVKRASLAARVDRDVDAILAAWETDDLGPAMPELPQAIDLTAYSDSYAAARKTCPHDTVEQPLYGKAEVFCTDCERFMSVSTYQTERTARSKPSYRLFGWS